MNIALLCISSAWGGLELNVYRLAARLRERGHRVTLIAAPGTPIYEQARREQLPVKPLPVRSHYADLVAARRLGRLLKEIDTYLLLFSVAKDNYVAGWAKQFFLPKLRLFYMQQMQLGVPKKGLVQTWLYRNLAAWIAPLHLLAQQAKEKTKMPPERIHVVPLGIDPAQFAGVREQQAQARKRLQLPEEAFIVGIIGRIDPAKGHEYLVKAAALLHQAGKAVHVLFVGEETRGDTRNYPQYLQQLTAKGGIGEYVHFRPFTPQPQLAYAALDAFVMASVGETYGMVTVEAMASGLPVIGTDSGGTPELLGGGKYGLLVKQADELALAGALQKVLASPVLRAELGAAARQHATRTFSYQQQCRQLEELLGKAVSR